MILNEMLLLLNEILLLLELLVLKIDLNGCLHHYILVLINCRNFNRSLLIMLVNNMVCWNDIFNDLLLLLDKLRLCFLLLYKLRLFLKASIHRLLYLILWELIYNNLLISYWYSLLLLYCSLLFGSSNIFFSNSLLFSCSFKCNPSLFFFSCFCGCYSLFFFLLCFGSSLFSCSLLGSKKSGFLCS